MRKSCKLLYAGVVTGSIVRLMVFREIVGLDKQQKERRGLCSVHQRKGHHLDNNYSLPLYFEA